MSSIKEKLYKRFYIDVYRQIGYPEYGYPEPRREWIEGISINAPVKRKGKLRIGGLIDAIAEGIISLVEHDGYEEDIYTLIQVGRYEYEIPYLPHHRRREYSGIVDDIKYDTDDYCGCWI